MVIILILCIIGSYICCYLTFKTGEEKTDLKQRKEKSNVLFVTALILSILAAIISVKMIDNNGNSGAVGSSTYYVNGKKVSSSSYAASQNFMIGFMISIFLFGTGMAISANIIKKKNTERVESKDKKPSMVALFFSILASFFGGTLITTGLSAMADILEKNSDTAPYIALILGIVLITLGIRGIVLFVRRKKLQSNKV